MTNRPKAVGTAAESAVTKALRRNGFPNAERAALRGRLDVGDITGIGPHICIEVKGGNAAKTASDAQVAAWLDDTDTESVNKGADLGVLVLARKGIGPANADRWWAVMRAADVGWLLGARLPAGDAPVRMLLADACGLLTRYYGTTEATA